MVPGASEDPETRSILEALSGFADNATILTGNVVAKAVSKSIR